MAQFSLQEILKPAEGAWTCLDVRHRCFKASPEVLLEVPRGLTSRMSPIQGELLGHGSKNTSEADDADLVSIVEVSVLCSRSFLNHQE